MKMMILAAGLIAIAAPVQATSPFDGVWIWDAASTELSSKPDVYQLGSDHFRCASCPSPYELPADGKPYPVVGQSVFDAAAVTVESPQRVRLTTTKGGKSAMQIIFTLAPGNMELSTDISDLSSGTAVTSRVISQRVANAVVGEHALSGSWRQTRIEAASESATTVRLKVTRTSVAFSDPSGFQYDARFDGRDYPVSGVAVGRTVRVRRTSDSSFEETQKQDGKIVSVISLTVDPNRKTARYVFQDRVEGVTTRGTLNKQQPDPVGKTTKAREELAP
ncbi:MAG: hypothetical protein ABI395_00190 [Sphingobium sp.]